MIFDIVPGEDAVAVGSGVLDRAEPRREGRPVLRRLELGFGERVVVGHVRPAVGLRDPQVGQQERDGLRGHRHAAVGVDRQLLAGDALSGAGLMDELLGQRGALAMGHHPADYVAAEHIQHDVQVEVRDNYYETISDSLLDAVAHAFDDEGFRKALGGK